MVFSPPSCSEGEEICCFYPWKSARSVAGIFYYRTSKLTAIPAKTFCPAAGV